MTPVAREELGEGLRLYTWTADQVDPRHRFDEWRSVRSKALFGVTAELEPEQHAHFKGEFTLQKLGHAGLVELRASPYSVTRSARDIAEAPSDSLCIYQQLSEGGCFDTRDGFEFTLRSGHLATSYSDLPYRTRPAGADGFHLRIVKIPVASLWPARKGLHDLFAEPFDDRSSLAPLLESCFADLVSAGESIEPQAAAPLIEALGALALVERGVVRPGGGLARQALRVARLSFARRLIASQLSDPHLSPALIANQLGVSIRHVHALFEASAMSFSQTVTAMRLDESRRLLVQEPERPIAKIAFACGFESLATFYRVFHAAHGVAPGDFRQAASRDA
jgi:AraC-like DNA-binding protein